MSFLNPVKYECLEVLTVSVADSVYDKVHRALIVERPLFGTPKQYHVWDTYDMGYWTYGNAEQTPRNINMVIAEFRNENKKRIHLSETVEAIRNARVLIDGK
jgi:hypothetical protein